MKKKVFTNSKNLIAAIEEHISIANTQFYVFDNNCRDKEICGYPTISFEELKRDKEQYEVLVTNSSIRSAYELCKQMKENSIEFKVLAKNTLLENTLHISGHFGSRGEDLSYEWVRSSENRSIYSKLEAQMEGMFRATFESYRSDFEDKDINIFFYLEDMPQDAFRLAQLFDIDYIFACCTVFPVSTIVIPIPNYFACIDENTYQWQEEVPSRLRAASEKSWSVPKAVWIGDVNNSPDDLRRMLYILGERFSDKLEIINSAGYWQQMGNSNALNKFIPMVDLARYKYLIDIRGWSFYARMTRLLQMSRVVLRVESIYKEWYDDYLIPMKHYVPIKADMSDLISKIDYLENRSDIYEEIADGSLSFADKYLQPEAYLCYLKNVILRYGIKKDK